MKNNCIEGPRLKPEEEYNIVASDIHNISVRSALEMKIRIAVDMRRRPELTSGHLHLIPSLENSPQHQHSPNHIFEEYLCMSPCTPDKLYS
jgi:hypothetical protein